MKQFRRILCMVLCVVLLVTSTFCITAAADTGEIIARGVCGSTMRWTLDASGTLRISGSGKMTEYTWDTYKGQITEVIISEGVMNICYTAFSDCTRLEKVTIPNGVSAIGQWAFSDCSNLKSIRLPDSVISIDMYAFSKCSALQDVRLPDGLAAIERGIFRGCTSLKTIDLPTSMTSIGEEAFSDCASLKTINLPRSMTSIGSRAFSDCASLKTINLPRSMTSIGSSAFYKCVSLKTMELPDSVTSIGSGAFSGCENLEFMRLPSNLSVISEGLFRDCTSLSQVVFPKSIAVIEQSAFSNCRSLKIVTVLGGQEQWNSLVIADRGNAQLVYAKKDYHETHDYTETVHAPSCTERGYTEYYCAVCGVSTVGAYTDALGHDFSGEAQRREPTCTENGEESRSCVRCGFMDTKTFPALGHDYKNGICQRCGHAVSADFRDVPANEWYKDAVDYAVGMGLMNGVGGGKFAPEDSMTRAMLVTVLWRYADSPTEGTNQFSDVPDGQWYTAAVAWAAGKGVVNGTSVTTFEPDGNVTREQMAAILYRYANSLSVDTGKRGDFTAFADANAVSGWAKDALSWTVAEGIIGGSKEGGQLLLNPAGNATRAQVAAILMRFIENVTK